MTFIIRLMEEACQGKCQLEGSNTLVGSNNFSFFWSLCFYVMLHSYSFILHSGCLDPVLKLSHPI